MKIDIENLEFKCIIGILDFERVKKQKVIINLSFEYDFSNDKFIDYSEVVDLIKETMKKEKFQLIEDAILYLTKLLNQTYEIKNLKLKISKPTILKDCIVSLSN
ncbi:dihydroneopterin aldolase [Aliarcobacter butzleri]|uniref:dihydroneopterin aldolase n=1 Tax=Aliarcobacter butzleri TaxID=28197 RepID=A0AAP4PWE6_9BACT|nr:dihydroneopterin aldolase [Aliarcobacter butzleri]MCG3674832.1 dihydroneopterin aldolase [Aliarcobacter butzleri]MDN5050869.1 dihydroneopterin aldolase [Aliarcobacter butzleri]MDN5074452.1 dihydroneopterin aldolase [Aliarcobacter butzleri]MDN5115444.1 dihydroneopterin aldolase [Aliarcobacter butzleri]MDN5131214.1 dihydroneopterin aldolase [Aliarcobacter butzleri]